MSEHTPGPWGFEDSLDLPEIEYAASIKSEFTGQEIGRVANYETILKETKANARLIAAVPELLEELESNVESINLALNDISRMREYEAFDTDEYNDLDELRAHLEGTRIRTQEIIKKAKGGK